MVGICDDRRLFGSRAPVRFWRGRARCRRFLVRHGRRRWGACRRRGGRSAWQGRGEGTAQGGCLSVRRFMGGFGAGATWGAVLRRFSLQRICNGTRRLRRGFGGHQRDKPRSQHCQIASNLQRVRVAVGNRNRSLTRRMSSVRTRARPLLSPLIPLT